MTRTTTSRHRVGISRHTCGEPIIIGYAVKARGNWNFEPAVRGRHRGRAVTRFLADCLPRWLGPVERLTFIAGKWTITYAPPPIPVRAFDWQFVSADYDAETFSDGTTSDNGLCGAAASPDACLDEIAEREESSRAEIRDAFRRSLDLEKGVS